MYRILCIGWLVLFVAGSAASAAEPAGGDFVEITGLKLAIGTDSKLSIELSAAVGVASQSQGTLFLMLQDKSGQPLAGYADPTRKMVNKGVSDVTLKALVNLPKEVETVAMGVPLVLQGAKHTDITKARWIIIKTIGNKRVPTFQDTPPEGK